MPDLLALVHSVAPVPHRPVPAAVVPQVGPVLPQRRGGKRKYYTTYIGGKRYRTVQLTAPMSNGEALSRAREKRGQLCRRKIVHPCGDIAEVSVAVVSKAKVRAPKTLSLCLKKGLSLQKRLRSMQKARADVLSGEALGFLLADLICNIGFSQEAACLSNASQIRRGAHAQSPPGEWVGGVCGGGRRWDSVLVGTRMGTRRNEHFRP